MILIGFYQFLFGHEGDVSFLVDVCFIAQVEVSHVIIGIKHLFIEHACEENLFYC